MLRREGTLGASLDDDGEHAREEARLEASDGASGGARDEDGEDALDDAWLEAADGTLVAVRLDERDGTCDLAELEARLEALDEALVEGSMDGTESSGPIHSGRASPFFLVLDLEDERREEE